MVRITDYTSSFYYIDWVYYATWFHIIRERNGLESVECIMLLYTKRYNALQLIALTDYTKRSCNIMHSVDVSECAIVAFGKNAFCRNYPCCSWVFFMPFDSILVYGYIGIRLTVNDNDLMLCSFYFLAYLHMSYSIRQRSPVAQW